MPTFKDFLEADLNTFFNIDEFAEMRNIDGSDILVVIEEDLSHSRPRQPEALYNAASGVYVEQISLFVKLADWISNFQYRPVVQQTVRLDDERYTVAHCNEQVGVLEIILEANTV